ncbi:restriction endonuclease subunit S [Vibrio parahaemolyticus]|uniref:restriction endonuclease subunit S n=1 Tax=Vibrio parahaemolyticus TaxID=670 RepID=UPI001C55D2AE|nr:restriction endonuclease subunit S [Vibrio parahaemolyticus]
MSNLGFMEKLLDGVDIEWKSLTDIFQLKNGYTPSKSKKEFWESGTVPWFRMDDIRERGNILNEALQKKYQRVQLKGENCSPQAQ